ncbi:hypothetical protein GUJ93_ZPchr0014g47451 [Zizania palustris]|uniref:Uncharacterized protein n=1 Tax=Zizania palustris TaxID=103762 RepID=A0A8J5T7T2_ZIZPA|nr:hypothetical protein GUJ93_ZPchr0014g47451 [Zizania palustris]
MCVWCSSAPSSEAHAKQRNDVSLRKQPARCSRGLSFWRVVARNERCLTYAVVVATLQLLFHLTGAKSANVATLFLPILSQATGCRRWAAALVGTAVLVLVNAGGILGSVVAARVYGDEVMCVVGGVLVFCQLKHAALAYYAVCIWS